MADPVSYTDGDAYPDLKLDMFGTAGSFDDFNRRNDATGQRDSMEVVWKTCNRFFEEAAAALKALGSKIVLEFICGGLSEELAKMRLKGDLTRPPTFPRKYTRMWLSNVPWVMNLALWHPYLILFRSQRLYTWSDEHDHIRTAKLAGRPTGRDCVQLARKHRRVGRR